MHWKVLLFLTCWVDYSILLLRQSTLSEYEQAGHGLCAHLRWSSRWSLVHFTNAAFAVIAPPFFFSFLQTTVWKFPGSKGCGISCYSFWMTNSFLQVRSHSCPLFVFIGDRRWTWYEYSADLHDRSRESWLLRAFLVRIMQQ